jgi:hypothetical protein
MSFITEKEPDMVVITGDNARHSTDDAVLPRTWEEIVQANTKVVKSVVASVKAGTPVFSAIGNNDIHPHDTVAAGPNEILAGLADAYSAAFASTDEKTTFVLGGYYTRAVNVKNNKTNLRVVVLHTNYFATFNTIVGDCDSPGPAADQMRWLGQVLDKAQSDHEPVIIIGHVAPQDYKTGCGESFNALINKYQQGNWKLIRGLFFGHKHYDDFSPINPGSSGKKADAVAFLAPSVVPNFNPAIRLYKVDNDKIELEDYEQYYSDMTKWNSGVNKGSFWSLEYTAVKDLNLKDMSPDSWALYYANIQSDASVAKTYNKYKTVLSGVAPSDVKQHTFDGMKEMALLLQGRMESPTLLRHETSEERSR